MADLDYTFGDWSFDSNNYADNFLGRKKKKKPEIKPFRKVSFFVRNNQRRTDGR